MCGIAGIFHFATAHEPVDATLVARMTDVLAHRGPDDRGTWVDGPIGLGHRRLSVIDLSSHGRQPMSNEDGQVQITYNGEVYNFQELRAEYQLEARGHRFQSRTDTEVLIHLYEELGLKMLPALNGMYAFGLWDGRSKELHLVRDRYGIKPLFYTVRADRILFGSEIKAILEDPSIERRVDLQAMHDFLTFDYIPGPQTAFAGIHEVPPGHVLTITQTGQVSLRRYWQPQYAVDNSLTEAAATEAALQAMREAVTRQLVSDVPVGVLLSGGLDSSALVALMATQRSKPIHTYSVGFEDASFNELPYARRVAQQFGTTQHEVVITAHHVREMLPKYLTYIDEPYADGSAIPTYYVCQLAKQQVTVVLSGEGGDEAFAGYETHAAYRASTWFRRVPRWIRHGILAPLVYRLPVSHKKLSLEFKLKRFLGGQDLALPDAHLWWRIVLSEDQKRALYQPDVLEQFEPQVSARFFREIAANSPARDDLNRILHIDSTVFLPDDLMIKNDRMSMAHSLEARVPMTDNDLTGLLERVPPHLKLKGLRKKNIMRHALTGILPAEILNKKKVGLEMPYSRWLREDLRDMLLDYCGPTSLGRCGLFRPSAVQTLIDQHMAKRVDHGRALWGLLNFMMWWDLYRVQR